MTRIKMRILISVWFVSVFICLVFWTRGASSVHALKDIAQLEQSENSKVPAQLLLGSVSSVGQILLFVGAVGLFIFKRWGRAIFAVGFVLTSAITPFLIYLYKYLYPSGVSPSSEGLFWPPASIGFLGLITRILSITILTCVYSKIASHLYAPADDQGAL